MRALGYVQTVHFRGLGQRWCQAVLISTFSLTSPMPPDLACLFRKLGPKHKRMPCYRDSICAESGPAYLQGADGAGRERHAAGHTWRGALSSLTKASALSSLLFNAFALSLLRTKKFARADAFVSTRQKTSNLERESGQVRISCNTNVLACTLFVTWCA